MNPPNPEDIPKWHRWFGVEANNKTWDLTELSRRTPSQEEEMLSMAHVSAFHWDKIGTDLNRSRAAMLLCRLRHVFAAYEL